MSHLLKDLNCEIRCLSFEVPSSLFCSQNNQYDGACILHDIINAAKHDNANHAIEHSVKHSTPSNKTCIYQEFKQTPTHLNRINLDPDKPHGILVINIGDKNNAEHNSVNRRITSIHEKVLVPENILKVILPNRQDLKRNILGKATFKRTPNDNPDLICIDICEQIKVQASLLVNMLKNKANIKSHG